MPTGCWVYAHRHESANASTEALPVEEGLLIAVTCRCLDECNGQLLQPLHVILHQVACAPSPPHIKPDPRLLLSYLSIYKQPPPNHVVIASCARGWGRPQPPVPYGRPLTWLRKKLKTAYHLKIVYAGSKSHQCHVVVHKTCLRKREACRTVSRMQSNSQQAKRYFCHVHHKRQYTQF